jgi:hypothetical protein
MFVAFNRSYSAILLAHIQLSFQLALQTLFKTRFKELCRAVAISGTASFPGHFRRFPRENFSPLQFLGPDQHITQEVIFV